VFELANPVSLAKTEQLLLEGGDARIALEPRSKTNKYGCSPVPTPTIAAFGSSTASSISELGFAAANRLRDRLAICVDEEPHDLIYTRELNRIRQELLHLCSLADLPGLATVLAASGTDLHLIAAQLAAGPKSTPTLIVMMEAAETGNGVPAALSGLHFSPRSALGHCAIEGTPVAEGSGIQLATVAVRLTDGSLRPIAEVDTEVESLVMRATHGGQRVLLVLVDISKTGLLVPSPSCVSELRQRMPETLDVMVDACQFRIAPPTLRSYLQHGFMVALTGSKFLTGPAFSGALLIPSPMTSRFRKCRLPHALSAYSTRAEWPAIWEAASQLDDGENFGLLLRWEAALADLRAFYSLPEKQVADFMQVFADAMHYRLKNDPVFELLPIPAIDRHPFINSFSWDQIPTIFPFLLYRPGPRQTRVPLDREQTLHIYHLLQSDLAEIHESGAAGLRCQMGQPVNCGVRNGVAVSALRLCNSSRLIVEATGNGGTCAGEVVKRALAALDKVALLVNSSPAL
jgi:hypothetical protein